MTFTVVGAHQAWPSILIVADGTGGASVPCPGVQGVCAHASVYHAEHVNAGENWRRPGSRSDNLPPRTPLPHGVEDCDA
jgi:hypothetical protein